MFAALDPEQLQTCFLAWVKTVAQLSGGVLDVAFQEDGSRICKDHAPENLALIRHVALNLLRQETLMKRGIKGKRLRAGWDEDYLSLMLAG